MYVSAYPASPVTVSRAAWHAFATSEGSSMPTMSASSSGPMNTATVRNSPSQTDMHAAKRTSRLIAVVLPSPW